MARQRAKLLFQLLGDFVAAGPAKTERAEVLRARARLADKMEQRAWQHRHHGWSHLAQQWPKLGVVESSCHHGLSPDAKRGQGKAEAADMRAGRAGEHDIVGGDLESSGGARRHPAERLETVGHALGRSGAAGGEKDGRGRGRIWIGQSNRRGIGAHQLLKTPVASLLGAVADDPERQMRCLAGGDVTGTLGVRQDDPGAADVEGVVDLGWHVAVVERCDDEPGLETGEVMGQQRDPVRHQRGDAVSRLQAECQIILGQTVGAVLKFAPGPTALERQDRRPVAARVQTALQQ